MKKTKYSRMLTFFKFFLTLLIFYLNFHFSTAQENWTSTTTSSVPLARFLHTAIWTGSKMIVWGGYTGSGPYTNTGGLYDPLSNSWTTTSITNAPSSRYFHNAVWTGTKMIIWGGAEYSSFVNTGGVYDPVTNTWSATSLTNAPIGRINASEVWTGLKMIVWGGRDVNANRLNSGGIYDPVTNSWTTISTTNAPAPRDYHTAVWTGSKMIIWGGSDMQLGLIYGDGGVYDPVNNTWSPVTVSNAPEPRNQHCGVWTSNRMLIWGGSGNSNELNSGGLYDPITNTWTVTTLTGAPSVRVWSRIIWTGTKAILWGGLHDTTALSDGGIYDPLINTWSVLTNMNAPSARFLNTAVWTGNKMIAWGGKGNYSDVNILNTGGVYSNPAIVSVSNINNEIPSGFILEQNYPNPFNPSTKIAFSIPPFTKGGLGGFVQLVIYDITGKAVQTLVNETLQPGKYEVTFDASVLSSDLYFYKLSAGDFIKTKKMILIK